MGCVSSKPDINDQHPNIFQVSNVNEQGELISHGQLEVTETELILYQRGKQPTRWPLRSLRKYGFDSEIFSFECGRRCPTGHGIYAFRCRKAEQLFNIVQQYIARNLNDDIAPNTTLGVNVIVSPNNAEFPIPITSTGPPVTQRRPISQLEGYLNHNSTSVNVSRPHPTLSRPGSITSNGPVSPTTLSPPITANDISLEHNNNKRGSLPDQSYTVVLSEPVQANYANVGVITSPTGIVPPENYVNLPQAGGDNAHLYMNIDAKDVVPNQTNTKDAIEEVVILPEGEEDARHCYANIDTKELEHLRPIKLQSSIDIPHSSVPPTPTSLFVTVEEVNYAELDLDPGKSDVPVSVLQAAPDSPSKAKKSYATIDFNKTNALSQSINPSIENEEGSRKTRHNSTISDVTTRHSNSLSD